MTRLGFEPRTSWLYTGCSNHWAIWPWVQGVGFTLISTMTDCLSNTYQHTPPLVSKLMLTMASSVLILAMRAAQVALTTWNYPGQKGEHSFVYVLFHAPGCVLGLELIASYHSASKWPHQFIIELLNNTCPPPLVHTTMTVSPRFTLHLPHWFWPFWCFCPS